MKSIDALLAATPKLTHEATISGQKVEITPLSLMVIAKLLRRFPAAMKALMGQGDDLLDVVVACGPEALSAVIVAGLGAPGDLEQELKAQQLPDEVQMELLAEIMQITMPQGLEDFLSKLLPFVERLGMIAAPTAPTAS